MAIGFSLPGIPGQIRGTPEEAGAMPDLSQAMMQGFRSNIENVQGAPRLLSQKLLANALSNKIRGVEAKYAEPMAKTGYDQALANLQHQGLINQYYGRLQESNLRGQGLTQTHQQMVNAMLKRQLDRQKRYDELLEEYRKQGASPEQAHDLALQTVNQTHPMQEQQPQQPEQLQQDLAQTILGAQMPDYLANIAPQGQQAPADIIGQNVPYTPIQQRQIGLQYTPAQFAKQPSEKKTIKEKLEEALVGQQFGNMSEFLSPETQNQLLGSAPQMQASDVAAQGYEGVSPIQSPVLRRQEALAQAFQLPASAQPVPEYLQRPEEAAMAIPEAQAVPMQAPAQAVEAPAQQSYAQQLQQAGFDTTNSNPVYAAADQVYLKNPNYRDLLKQEFPNIGIKQFNDFPRNRIITTETLPSGATRTQMHQLPGTLPGQNGAGFKTTGAILSTPAGRAIARNNLVDNYGENSPQVKEFDKNAKLQDEHEELARDLKKQQLELNKQKIEIQKETNRFRAQSLDIQKRKSLGKAGQALANLYDAKAGFIPGTDKKFLTQEDQQKAIKTFESEVNKVATDTTQRNKLIAANQIEQTIQNLDIDALTAYSGVFGSAQLKKDEVIAGLSGASPEYQAYTQARTQAELLAKQIRQFYGDSIQPTAVKQIKALTNPNSWAVSPEQAKQNYLAFTNTLGQETNILKDVFVYANSSNFNKTLNKAKYQAVDDQLKAYENEMRKRGIKVGE